MKDLFIAEKPSVAKAYAQVLQVRGGGKDGYMESERAVVTWCVGHLVTMCYPEAYDPAMKRWTLEKIPFLPAQFKYEVIANVKKQFGIVSGLLKRADIGRIYVCTDAGREGEYIYRLVEMMSGVRGKERRRVWIDAQTEEEILRGIREAKDLSAYDNLSASAYLRAKEDYLMGINFSRAVTLKYAKEIKNYLNIDKCVIAIGRVMTCVLGMVVTREREIRDFVKTPYYGVEGCFLLPGAASAQATEAQAKEEADAEADAEAASRQTLTAAWKAVKGSRYHESPLLYNEKGFRERASAKALISSLGGAEEAANSGKEDGAQERYPLADESITAVIEKNEKKTEKKYAPLLYNLAELQNDCARSLKISPDETLQIAQELYEKKLTTYHRTDARVLSTAAAKEIEKNIRGLEQVEELKIYAKSIIQHGTHKTIAKTRYVNDKQVTDHYAIIPTGQGTSVIKSLKPNSHAVYMMIARRFLSVFFPPAVYEKIALTIAVPDLEGKYTERFYTNFRLLQSKGYLHVAGEGRKAKAESAEKKKADDTNQDAADATEDSKNNNRDENETVETDEQKMELLRKLRKGTKLNIDSFSIKESETTPPKRYNSGTLILAMENAGQFIEDEELRAQIKGAGIGTSATRAEILKKLVGNAYLNLNKKTQIITPTQTGEMIYETVAASMPSMLKAELTASWEKGLAGVAEGRISEAEYMEKLEGFIRRQVEGVKSADRSALLKARFDAIAPYYPASCATGHKNVKYRKGSGGRKT
ncbi:MAG: type IA DNA topoisomerase [Lachnospiraceae bacterium]|nr:type IA DNA topoisomerase [Lachnospiraceae bacterium]